MRLEGEVDTATIGVDVAWGQWLAGLAVSHSDGRGRFSDGRGGAGEANSNLTGVYPYAYYQLNRRTSFWGVAGYGGGNMRLMPDETAPAADAETDINNTMAAFGGRSAFSINSWERGRLEFALRTDALLTKTSADATRVIEAADASTRRLRLLLEATGSVVVGGGLLSPTLEAGLRHDGGDAEQGTALELGGGLAWRSGGLTLQFNGRGLLSHADDAYEEWGYSAGIQYEPGVNGRGIQLSLVSTGGASFGGADQLWEMPDASGMTRGSGAMQGLRTEFELGYGLGAIWRDALWYPYLGVESRGGDQALNLGVKLNSGTRLNAGLEYGRRSGGESPVNAIMLKGSYRF